MDRTYTNQYRWFNINLDEQFFGVYRARIKLLYSLVS